MLLVLALFVFMAGQQELMAVKALERERQRRHYLDEEPVPVISVRPATGPVPVIPLAPLRPAGAAPEPVQPPLFGLQPTISVFTFDPETGEWVKEPRTPPRQPSWGQLP